MREGADLFFAPDIRFEQVHEDDVEYASQFESRVRGYYLEPAQGCIDHNQPFAAGVLILAAIEFLATADLSAEALALNCGRTGQGFKDYARDNLKSFSNAGDRRVLWEDFRNGLIHEGRVKNGREFSLRPGCTIFRARGQVCINPRYLLREVEEALSAYAESLRQDEEKLAAAGERYRTLFAVERGIAEQANVG